MFDNASGFDDEFFSGSNTPSDHFAPTIEEQRAYLAQIRRGYELAEQHQRQVCSPMNDEQKIAFDRLMQDAYAHRKSNRHCGMTEWYAAFLQDQHE